MIYVMASQGGMVSMASLGQNWGNNMAFQEREKQNKDASLPV